MIISCLLQFSCNSKIVLKGFPMPSLILNKFLRIDKNLPNELFYE